MEKKDWTTKEDINVHSFFESHKANQNGTHTVYYDAALGEWFGFVVNRGQGGKETSSLSNQVDSV
jgi:hypothetical protein